MASLRKRRLRFLLRPRPRPAGPLPKPGELEGRLPPKEQRPLKNMFWRTKREWLPTRGFPRRYPVLWGSYTFDSLFRLALGMFFGFLLASLVASGQGLELPWKGNYSSGHGVLLALLAALPPTGTLIGLAFRWRKEYRIRRWLFLSGLVFGSIHFFLLYTVASLLAD